MDGGAARGARQPAGDHVPPDDGVHDSDDDNDNDNDNDNDTGVHVGADGGGRGPRESVECHCQEYQ